jgi:hypothetical protein
MPGEGVAVGEADLAMGEGLVNAVAHDRRAEGEYPLVIAFAHVIMSGM